MARGTTFGSQNKSGGTDFGGGTKIFATCPFTHKDTICVSCKKNAAKNAIECDRCSKWEHKTCAHVSDEMYGLINKVPENITRPCTFHSSLQEL